MGLNCKIRLIFACIGGSAAWSSLTITKLYELQTTDTTCVLARPASSSPILLPCRDWRLAVPVSLTKHNALMAKCSERYPSHRQDTLMTALSLCEPGHLARWWSSISRHKLITSSYQGGTAVRAPLALQAHKPEAVSILFYQAR